MAKTKTAKPKAEKTKNRNTKSTATKSKNQNTKKNKKSKTPSPPHTAPHKAHPAPNHIFLREGTIFRPFIVVKPPTTTPWLTPNIAFYKSSGRSNDKFSGKYANTWLPTAGILDKDTTIHGKPEEKGYIIKMSTLYGSHLSAELCELLRDYITKKYKHHTPTVEIAEKVFSELKTLKDPKINHFSSRDILNDYLKITEEIHEIYVLLSGYFTTAWQVYISAHIGGGYWSINEPFQTYIVNLKINNITIPTIPTTATPAADETGNNDDEVISFLKNNGAQLESASITEIKKNPDIICDRIDINYAYLQQSIIIQDRRIAASQKANK
jgi:hypothetical protein